LSNITGVNDCSQATKNTETKDDALHPASLLGFSGEIDKAIFVPRLAALRQSWRDINNYRNLPALPDRERCRNRGKFP
jgi:hypothetical protein